MKIGILGSAILLLIVAAIVKSLSVGIVALMMFGLLFYLRKKTPH